MQLSVINSIMSKPIYDRHGRKIGELQDNSYGGCLAALFILGGILYLIISGLEVVDDGIQSLIYKSNSNRIVSGANQLVLNGRKTGNIIASEYGVWLGNKGASVTMDVTVRVAGNYSIKIITAEGSNYSVYEKVDVSVNGGPPIRVPLTFLSWDKKDTPGNANISLQAGKNTITLSNWHQYPKTCNQDRENINNRECTYIGNIVIN